MAHYAKVRQGKVIKVIVAKADFFDNFVDDSPGTWIQTSYNTRGGVHYEPNSNDPSEDQSKALRGTLHKAGVTQLNQSVLLKSVNDAAATLAELSERLFSINILPYYLHLLDRVSGAAHFLVPDSEAKIIYRELAEHLPGFLVPKLARETSGNYSKDTFGTDNL